MNQYVTGAMIKGLREKKGLTQAELAGRLNVSDKTVSKWETGKGYPDISCLEPIAKVLDVSIAELLSGSAVVNANVSANMLRSKLYVCPICGNVLHSMGEAVISCHGINLVPAEGERGDSRHEIKVELVEDEYFVHINHAMTKKHYISFIAAVSLNSIQLCKLYPEGEASCRFKRSGIQRIYFYCNQDGMYYQEI